MASKGSPSLSDLLAQPQFRPGPKCGIRTVLSRLDAGDRATLVDALAEPAELVQHAQLSRALKALGYRVGADTIARHRNGECGCNL